MSMLPVAWEFGVELSFPVGVGFSGGILNLVFHLLGSLFSVIFTTILDIDNDDSYIYC